MVNQNTVWLVISIVVVAVFFAVWLRKRIKLRQAQDWPAAQGRVDSTDLRMVGSGTQQAKWIATIAYSYTVDGTARSGKVSRPFMLKGSATKWADNFTTGTAVVVRVNPKNSADSVLLEDEQGAARS